MTTTTRLHWTENDDDVLVAGPAGPDLTVWTVEPTADGWDLFWQDWEAGAHVGTFPTRDAATAAAERMA